MQCPICGFDSPPEMNFCGRCGTRLKQICSKCRFANPLDFHYCGQCGLPLAELAPSPVQPAGEAITPPLAEAPVPLQQQPSPLEGERRQATVLLADIFGSTSLLEQIGTEEWVAVMNDVLQIIEAEVYRFGGEVNQFRGDGLIAFFGATSAHEDDPERAVLAGLSLQAAVSAYAARLAEQRGIDLRLRVGVNTGEVIVTSIGERHQHRESTAMGEAVAVAARLETAAEPGTVLVSENTYRRVQSLFEWQPLEHLVVKGVTQPLSVYRPLYPQLERKSGRPDRLQIYGLSIPLIGREDEFEVLKRTVENLTTGRGSIVLLTGDEGIGKSRLVTEVRRHVFRDIALLAEAQDHARNIKSSALLPLVWLRGQCRSYEQSRPYSMWHDLLRRWLGVGQGESAPETRQRLYHQAEALWGDQVAEHYPYLATFLSLPLEEPFAGRIKHLDAKELRQQTYATIRSWLEALARRGPLVVIFNDVHWADATSLDLLEYCLALCDQEALLWLIVIRPKRTTTAWAFCQRVMAEFPHRITHLSLQALTEAQIGEMIDRLIGSDILSVEMRELITRKAEGNPYYVEELIRSLIVQGVLVHDAETGQWRATRAVVSLDLPDTLQSLLLGRLDSLAAAERRVLHMAAVIGDVFWSNVLEKLVDGPAALKQHLAALQRGQLIEERGRVPDLGMAYVFKSRLLRQVAYDSILSAQRAGFHRQVAEYLEQRFNHEAPAQYYGMLAYHYQQAGERSKELLYTLLAAAEAKEAYANTEALLLYDRALELLDEMEAEATREERRNAILSQKFEVLNERRELFYIIGEFQAGRAAAQALLPLARRLDDDPVWLIDALLQQPGVANWVNKEELRAGRKLAEEAINLARQVGDRHREMQCLIALAHQGIELDDPAALTCAEQALALARELDDPYTEAQLLITISGIYSWSNEPERGRTYLEAAIPLCQRLDDKVAEIRLLRQISLQFERNGDYYRVLTEYQQRRLQLSREINHRSLEADALMVCGQVQGIYLGDYEAGLALEEEARRIWQDTPGEGVILLRMAQMLAAQGNSDEALATLEQARQIRVQAFSEWARSGLYLTSAIVYCALGDDAHLRRALADIEQARQLVAAMPRLSRQLEMASATKAAAIHLALAERTADEASSRLHRQQALESSQAALATYELFGYTQVIECVSEEIFFYHSHALAANERHEEAAQYLQRAYGEMMRKHALIPADSPFRQYFLENIPAHCHIRAAYTAYVSRSQ